MTLEFPNFIRVNEGLSLCFFDEKNTLSPLMVYLENHYRFALVSR